jgi:hypothetical protein
MSGLNKIQSILDRHKGSYMQPIHDPQQTHAIYGILKSLEESVKEDLRKIGAKRFRSVKPHAKGLSIICFDASGIE